MTFGEYPPEIHRSVSLADRLDQETTKSKRSHHRNYHKTKRPHTHVFNSLPWHRKKISSREKTNSIDGLCDQSASRERRPSIMKQHPMLTSDLSRCISKKSVTFASVFDLFEEEKIANQNDQVLTVDEIDAIQTEETMITEENFVEKSEEKTIDNDVHIEKPASPIPEPYPFRSEVPVTFVPSSEMTKSPHHHQSEKNLKQHFVFHRRPKKLRHPIQSIDPLPPVNRAISSPNIFCPTPISPNENKANHHHPLDSIRTWVKTSSIGRFVRSLVKSENNLSKQTDLPKAKKQKSKKKKVHIMSSMSAAIAKSADTVIY